MSPWTQEQRRVLIEVVPTDSPLAAGTLAQLNDPESPTSRALGEAGVIIDTDWPLTQVPAPPEAVSRTFTARARVERAREFLNKRVPVQVPVWEPPDRTAILTRALIAPDADVADAFERVGYDRESVQAFADPEVVAGELCRPGGPPCGTVAQAAERLGVSELHSRGLVGTGVPVVLVDGGLNQDALRQRGRDHPFDADLSYASEGAEHTPGEFPPGHGSMAAYQVGIAAPAATLVDHAAILRTASRNGEPLMHAWLSDILVGYRRLRAYLVSRSRDQRALVISNSWALVAPRWDFPVSDFVQNFSDNAEHPFNRVVRELVAQGADVLFCAGNCGVPERDPVCEFAPEDLPICGANSLTEVITVGAVDVDGKRAGYSAQGPGRLEDAKPDLCGYSHYEGSKIQGRADWGTSTACPVVAGVVAALRGALSPAHVAPEDLKEALTSTASRSPGSGHNYELGWGIVDPVAASNHLGV